MKKIIFILTLQTVLLAYISNAQPGYYPNRPSIGRHNRYSNCTEPFAEVRFNRDYPGLANTSLHYRDYEIRSYIRYKCLTSDQIRRLAQLYSTDGERERFLLYAFNFVFDLEDYSVAATSLLTVPMRNDFYQFLASKGIPTGDLVYVYPPNYYPNGNYNGYPPPPNNGTYNNYPPPNNNYPPQNGTPPNNGTYNNYPPQNGTPPNNGTYNNYPPPNNNYPPQNGTPPNNGTYNNYPPPNNNGSNNNQPIQNATIPPPASNTNINGNNTVQNNNNDTGNRSTISTASYENLKTQIAQKSFEKERIELANQTLKQNSLTSIQIAGIMRLLAFDNNRLDFAKYAYSYVYDKENYTAVTDALAFDSNKKVLKDFLATSSVKN